MSVFRLLEFSARFRRSSFDRSQKSNELEKSGIKKLEAGLVRITVKLQFIFCVLANKYTVASKNLPQLSQSFTITVGANQALAFFVHANESENYTYNPELYLSART